MAKQTGEVFEKKDDTEPSAMEPEFVEEPAKVEPEPKVSHLSEEYIASRWQAHIEKIK